MSAHQIGVFEFVNMHNPPEIPSERKTVQKRTGIDHVSTFLTGRRSEASMTRTVVFGSNLSLMMDEYRRYLTLVDSGEAVEVKWAGLTMPYKVQVLSVTRTENQPRAHVLGVGPGFVSRARLECIWRLQVVEDIK